MPFIDEHTGYIYIDPIIRKIEVLALFKIYHACQEKKFGCTLKRVQSDNGGEYIGIRDYIEEEGIGHRMWPPYSSNLNGMAKRASRSII